MNRYEWSCEDSWPHSEKPPVKHWTLKRPDGSPSYISVDDPSDEMKDLMFVIWRECNEMAGVEGFSYDRYPLNGAEKEYHDDVRRRARAGEFSPTMCADILGEPRPART